MTVNHGSGRERRDPREDAREVFDGHPVRLRMALQCRVPRRLAELAGVVAIPDRNARTMANTLSKYGVLETLNVRGQAARVVLAKDWRDPVDEARRRAAKGRLVDDQQLLLVPATGVPAAARLLAGRVREPRVQWAARVRERDPALVIAIDSESDDTAAMRLWGELEEAGASSQLLSLGEIAGWDELRGFLARLVPGPDTPADATSA